MLRALLLLEVDGPDLDMVGSTLGDPPMMLAVYNIGQTLHVWSLGQYTPLHVATANRGGKLTAGQVINP